MFLALFMVAFGRYSFRSWMQWWGSTMLDTQPRWMPLSWHNQSGALMGAFAVLFLGVALTTRRIVGFGMVLLAGAAGAGVWLSSSRGALGFTAIAATAVLVVALRGDRTPGYVKRASLVAGGTAATAVAVVFALLSMLPSGVETPLGSRAGTAAENAVARVNHIEAGVRMFIDRPVVGQGPGSYGVMALDFTDPDANLTTSAHNEYVEVLGEGGLVAGLPFLLLHLAIGVLVWRRFRHGVAQSSGGHVDVRAGTTLGLVGVVVLIAGHSSFDFDWNFAVLPSLLAVGAAAISVRAHEIGKEGGDISHDEVVNESPPA